MSPVRVSLENTPVMSFLACWGGGGGFYGLTDRDLQLATVVSHLVMKKIILTQNQVRILIQTSWYMLHPVRDM